jgi:hypothetical protein
MMAKLDAHHERMMACLGKSEDMDFEANPEEIKSVAEHQEVTVEEAAVKSLGALKKQHMGWHLVAGCHSQLQERTQGNCGSRKKLAAASRKLTHSAGVAQRKGHIVRKTQTGNNVARGAPRGQMSRRRCQPKLERKNGIRNRGLRQQL